MFAILLCLKKNLIKTNVFVSFSFIYIFFGRWCTFKCKRDPVVLEKQEICSEKIWSEMKKSNLSRALRNCGAARSAATAGHLTPPQSS